MAKRRDYQDLPDLELPEALDGRISRMTEEADREIAEARRMRFGALASWPVPAVVEPRPIRPEQLADAPHPGLRDGVGQAPIVRPELAVEVPCPGEVLAVVGSRPVEPARELPRPPLEIGRIDLSDAHGLEALESHVALPVVEPTPVNVAPQDRRRLGEEDRRAADIDVLERPPAPLRKGLVVALDEAEQGEARVEANPTGHQGCDARDS